MPVRSWIWGLAPAMVLAAASPAAAVLINYSDCSGGGTVTYVDISESSNQAPLFGAPFCAGDQIDFDPSNFQVGAGNPDPAGFASLDGQLNFTVLSDVGRIVENLSISESGDRQVLGFATVPATFASVSLITRLEIVISVGGTDFIVEFEDQQSDSWSIPADFSTTPQTWSLEADFMINEILDAACNGTGFYAGAAISQACGATSSQVKVALDNTLTVFANSGERAFVNKKDVDGVTVTANDPTPIPEPASGALLGAGLLALALRARRGRR